MNFSNYLNKDACGKVKEKRESNIAKERILLLERECVQESYTNKLELPMQRMQMTNVMLYLKIRLT